MRTTPSMAPAVMPLFRVRVAEVRALDCGDGRHLLLTEPPRYAVSAAFLEAFELVEERRTVERRHTNGRRPKRAKKKGAKGERRSVARRAAPTVADGIRAVVNGTKLPGPAETKKADARRLFEVQGRTLKEICGELALKYPTVYGWSKRDKWKPAAKKAAPPHSAAATPARQPAAAVPRKAGSDVDAGAGWMQ